MKDELKGQSVTVEVFERTFRDIDREESLEWVVAGQTISAGIVPQPILGTKKFTRAEDECITDIVESFRDANPKSIELRFPALPKMRSGKKSGSKAPKETAEEKPDFSRKQRVEKSGIVAFQTAIAGIKVISIAE